jgi:acyl-coenzyme A synthetase/AMP-(fatty) acid ligase
MFGERVVGYVVAQHGSHIVTDQLKAHCRRQLAAYKVPRNIEVCDKLPTTFLGKLRRVDLRARAASNGTPTNGEPTNGKPKTNPNVETASRVETESCPKP